jgi:hypothetical protein
MATAKIVICLNCGTQKSQKNTRGKYCSNQCQQDHALKARVSDWLEGKVSLSNKPLRRILAIIHGYECSTCGVTEWMGAPITLEVEHKNGNSEDNSPENVCLICPNCHSQTPTYKGANRGNGRHFRRVRYAEGKSY